MMVLFEYLPSGGNMFSVFGSLVDLDSLFCMMLEPARTKELVAEITKFAVVAEIWEAEVTVPDTKIEWFVCELF